MKDIKEMKKSLVLVLVLFASLSTLSAQALQFKDKPIDYDGVIRFEDVIRETEIHADGAITQQWFQGVSGNAPSASYQGLIDYRVEAHTPLYRLGAHKGSLITRLEGFAPIDEDIEDFFDDQLIDIPELFWQNKRDIGEAESTFVFGKFANRRFLDKDEIAPDPFDIGERPFFGTLANTNVLLNRINRFRDIDQTPSSIQATGSYGFYFGLEDKQVGDNFFDLKRGWGYKQVLAVAELEPFGGNFYGASEISKRWGDVEYPGKLTAGFLYAGDETYRLPEVGGGENSYLVYGSLVQRIIPKRLTGYFRYGSLNTKRGGFDNSIQHLITGLIFKPTKKDIVASHFLYLNDDSAVGRDWTVIHLNFWIHKFTEQLRSTFFVVPRYGVPSLTGFGGEDNSVILGFNLNYQI